MSDRFDQRPDHSDPPDHVAPARSALDVSRVAVLEAVVHALKDELDRRIHAQDRATALALSAAEKTTTVAQSTADRAVAKAEAAAGKEYLEAQIEALRQALVQQIASQKTAIDAALTAAKEALTAAQMSSEKAIQKAEEATEKRFEGVNEFRAQLSDQARSFATKAESDYRFAAIDKMLDADQQWQRRIELKFSDYVTSLQVDRGTSELAEWRRTVDAALTAAASKSGLMYAIFAMAIAAGGLMIALFNLFSKANIA
jgi:hypothetical protein